MKLIRDGKKWYYATSVWHKEMIVVARYWMAEPADTKEAIGIGSHAVKNMVLQTGVLLGSAAGFMAVEICVEQGIDDLYRVAWSVRRQAGPTDTGTYQRLDQLLDGLYMVRAKFLALDEMDRQYPLPF